ncbi:MAG: hypothetical protein OXG13_08990 [Gemmatimonadaceae bacterium]|nr:hypothetical protein [Gemmatimonadaceae bacterium]
MPAILDHPVVVFLAALLVGWFLLRDTVGAIVGLVQSAWRTHFRRR